MNINLGGNTLVDGYFAGLITSPQNASNITSANFIRLIAGFTGTFLTGRERGWIIGSIDGKTWNRIHGLELFNPPNNGADTSNGIRDLDITKIGNTYFIASSVSHPGSPPPSTPGGTRPYFETISSPDLVSWTHVAYINGTNITISPKWFTDPATDNLYVCSGGYIRQNTGKDGATWGPEIALAFSGVTMTGNADSKMIYANNSFGLFAWINGTTQAPYHILTGSTLASTFTDAGQITSWPSAEGIDVQGPDANGIYWAYMNVRAISNPAPTGNNTSGQNTITNLSSTAGLIIGTTVTGTGIPAGTTLVSVSGTTATLSNVTTAGATGGTYTFNSQSGSLVYSTSTTPLVPSSWSYPSLPPNNTFNNPNDLGLVALDNGGGFMTNDAQTSIDYHTGVTTRSFIAQRVNGLPSGQQFNDSIFFRGPNNFNQAYRLGTGTVTIGTSSFGINTLTGSGTIFTEELEPGTVIYNPANSQTAMIVSVSSDTSAKAIQFSGVAFSGNTFYVIPRIMGVLPSGTHNNGAAAWWTDGNGGMGCTMFDCNAAGKPLWIINSSSGESFFFSASSGAFRITDKSTDNFPFTIATGCASSTLALGTSSVSFAKNIVFPNAGNTVSLKGGTNACSGTVQLTSGSGTISSTAITTSSVIILTLKTASGANSAPQVTAGSGSATVTGLSTDNGTYNWAMLLANQ